MADGSYAVGEVIITFTDERQQVFPFEGDADCGDANWLHLPRAGLPSYAAELATGTP